MMIAIISSRHVSSHFYIVRIRVMRKQPEEVPLIIPQPEINPPQEPAGPDWPSHNPEVTPEEEPLPDLVPEEVPAPHTKSNHFILTDHDCI